MQPYTPMTVKPLVETEYDASICGYFSKEFPNVFKPNANELLEILAEILIGTKETRFGPIPPPEHLVVVRDVIRKSIEANIQIPILVPFGGIKGNKTAQLDIAEVSAIRRLQQLDESIKRYYPIGIQANIRVEDLGAVWLYGEHYEDTVLRYTSDLIRLTDIISGMGSNIQSVSEWNLMRSKTDYFNKSKEYSEILFEYLASSDNRPERLGKGTMFQVLEGHGWKGVIPQEQRDYYVNTYMKLEPGISRVMALKKLADYFGGSKARYDMNGTAAPTTKIGSYIQISYVQPIPGAPTSMTNNTLYYRTLPLSEARSHMPAWRSKGYLKIAPDGKAVAKITNFHDAETINQLIPSKVRLGDDGSYVDVHADYLLE
jgi:hypothetical protein